MTKLKTISLAILIALTPTTLFANDGVQFSDYMQYPAALSAISAGVALVSPCEIPIKFDETKSDGERVLGIHCRGPADYEASVFVRFIDDGYGIIPLGYDLAG